MRFVETEVAGVIVVEPDVHRDARGFFLETFHAAQVRGRRHPVALRPGQPLALGARHAARPAHADPQAAGQAGASDRGRDLGRGARRAARVADVHALDGCDAFGGELPAAVHSARLRARLLRDEPDVAQVQYKCTELYDPADEIGIAWNDPAAAISWPVRPIRCSRRAIRRTARCARCSPWWRSVAPVSSRYVGGHLQVAHGRAG